MNYRFITAACWRYGTVARMLKPLDKPASLEPAHSPFTYEALGATPSLQLGKRKARDGEAKLAAARERKSRSTT